MTLLDSNILIDIFSDDPAWYEWSALRVEEAIAQGPLVISDVVYAETSIRYSNIDDFEDALMRLDVRIAAIPRAALFLAGKIFQQYRRAGGTKSGVLPDFFIGAHAAVTGLTLLTRDPRRYRTYFPTIQLIAPESTV